MKPIAVLIVDDSATIRAMLRALLQQEPQISVCGEAADPYEARAAIKALKPDVITLDIEMPNMDGLTFLRNLMRLHPLPTVMISSLTDSGTQASVEALRIGAVDCIHKPAAGEIENISAEIVAKIKLAAQAEVGKISFGYKKTNPPIDSTIEYIENRLIAIGASTGGLPVIEQIISQMPLNCPPLLIVLHIPPNFSSHIATRLNKSYPIKVYEAYDNQPIEAGCAYLAPGDSHLEVLKQAGHYHCKIHKGEKVGYQRPSVDVMFNSISKLAKGNASAALLTGMGKDGAAGLLNMKNSACFTIIQNEASSAVWGMPGAAAALGAADRNVPLDQLGQALLDSSKVLIE